MSKKWVTLCLAGCFGVVLGIAGMSSSSAYAAEGKKLAMEGTVFDLKASSSTAVYGYVSDKEFHPVSDATVTVKSTQQGKAQTQTTTSDAKGSYSVDVESGKTYSLFASKDGTSLGRTRAIKLNITKTDDSDHIVNFQFKKIEK